MSAHAADLPVLRLTVEELLEQRRSALESYRVVMRALQQSKIATASGGFGEFALSNALDTRVLYHVERDGFPEQALERFRIELDRDLWRRLERLSGITQLMDSRARAEWRRGLETNPPACTLGTIMATFEQLAMRGPELFIRGLVDAFRDLSVRYRTNDAFRIGEKIIVSGGKDAIGDVDRVMYVLDGLRPPEVYDETAEAMLSALGGYGPDRGSCETPYLRIVRYRNGNHHVRFLRADLVGRANELLREFFEQQLPDGRAA